jgi:hypothetical protein
MWQFKHDLKTKRQIKTMSDDYYATFNFDLKPFNSYFWAMSKYEVGIRVTRIVLEKQTEVTM